jgi:hypothetical protein
MFCFQYITMSYYSYLVPTIKGRTKKVASYRPDATFFLSLKSSLFSVLIE